MDFQRKLLWFIKIVGIKLIKRVTAVVPHTGLTWVHKHRHVINLLCPYKTCKVDITIAVLWMGVVKN